MTAFDVAGTQMPDATNEKLSHDFCNTTTTHVDIAQIFN